MKVGLVCPYDLSRPGGVQAQVRGLAKTLTAMGDEVTVIGPGLAEEDTGVDLGRTISIPGNGSMAPISIDPRVRSRLKGATAMLDVLHIHEPLMPVASLAALRSGPPVVATFHAAPGQMATRLYKLGRSWVRRVLGPRVRRVTAVSEIAAEPLPPDLDVKLIPNGIDVSSFETRVERVVGRVSFLGRDEPRKGLDTLLAAWPTVLGRFEHAELVVMGAVRDDESATWMGLVDDETKAGILGSSEIYVAPNTGGESFGIVLIEAMACGTPVVASDLDAFQDVAGDVARYFAVGDAADLANRLITLLDSPEERARMARNGIERARRYDWSVVAGEYRNLYEDILS